MTVPNAVDQQAQDAEKAFEDFEKSLETPAPEATPPTPEATPPETPPAGEATPAVPTPAETLQKQLEYERHRNDSLQGRIDSQLRANNEELRQLRAQLAKNAERPAGPVVPANQKHLKPDEIANMDQQTLDLQGRVAQGVAESQVEAVREVLEQQNAELAARLEALEQSRSSEVAGSLWDSVEKLSPGAKAINEGDSGWVSFLDEVDDLSGRTRREIGSSAVAVGDVRRLASLVDEYRTASGLPAVKPVVAAQVRPAVTPSPGVVKPAAKPIFKDSQVKRFYENLNRGAYKGKEKEAEELEKQIDAAAQEGRIVAG